MLSHHNLGLLEVECDAPPYPIVRACRKLGLITPEDVRWGRISRQQKTDQGWVKSFTKPLWDRFLGRLSPHEKTCSCGHHMPPLESYSFTFQTGEQIDYALTQCLYCLAIYWEKL
jgi:hypothetical protein